MARTKTNTHNDTQTRSTARRNIHLEKTVCVFGFFFFPLFLCIIS